jgi:hypothetical protein
VNLLQWPLTLLLAASVAIAGCTNSRAIEKQAKASTLHLGLTDGNCSGTSIGHKLILTASHCFNSGHLLTVNDQPVNVESYRDDGADHRVIVLDTDFPPYAKFGKAPKQGDRAFMYGNPIGLRDVLRRGSVLGVSGYGYVLDITVGWGDSGAAVFNDRGEVIGVVKSIYSHGALPTFHVTLMEPLAEGEWPWNP